jgi:hypothetical protein
VGGITTGLWCTFLTLAHLVHFYLAGISTVVDPVMLSQMHGELLVLFACSIVSCFMGYSYENTVDGAWRVVNRTLRQVGTINGDGYIRDPDKISSSQTSSDAIWSGRPGQARSDFRLSKAKSSGDALALRKKSDLGLVIDASLFRRRDSETTARSDPDSPS